MSARLLVIESCRGCPQRDYLPLSSMHVCTAKRSRQIIVVDGVPQWCPLPKAPRQRRTK